MKKVIILLVAGLLAGCGEDKELKGRFMSSCEAENPFYRCEYLYQAMQSGCQSEKAYNAALVGGMIGSQIGGAGKK